MRVCRALSQPPPQLRPLGIGELLDIALKIVWRNAGTLARVVIFVVLPVQVVTALLAASASPSSLNSRSGNFAVDQPFSSSDVKALVGYTIAAAALSFISSSLASGACFRAIASAYLGERTDWRSSLGYALRHLHSIMWISFLSSLIGGLALLACIIPGVYLWTGFAVAIPALLTEGVRGSSALGRSRALVKGFWWRVFGVVVLGYLLTSVLGGAIEGVVLGVSTVQSGQASLVGVVVNIVAGTLSSMLTTPFVAAFVTVLYFDLRVRKEAFDLQLLAERIGVDPPLGAVLAPSSPLVDGGGEEPPFWPPPPGWKPRSGQGS